MELLKHARFLYQPVLPLGKNGKMVTCSKEHRAVAKDAAVEGTVLLKNDGTLPLATGAKIVLFGTGAGEFLFGGGGSGKVWTDRLVTLDDGLKEAAAKGDIGYFPQTAQFYMDEVQKIFDEARKNCETDAQFASWRREYRMPLPVLPEALYAQAKNFGDTAVFCVSRYSAEGDQGGDRTGGKGDFYLWDEEQQLLDKLCKDFGKVVVVINSCGPVSTTEYDKVGAVLYPLYGGSVAGEALVDILLGKRYPSGHLQHTLAKNIGDYPSTEGFHDHENYVNYTEDIFVGYRYFETLAPEKVAYPFGFGLGYTTFDVAATAAALEKNTAKVTVTVKNTGKMAGKEVVQLYLTAPQGKLGKAKKVLCAFAKTKELKPGEEAAVKLSFDIRQFGSFDDLGKVKKSAFILEQGEYAVQLGTNVRDTQVCLKFTLDTDIICRQCNEYMAPRALPERLTADGTMEKLPFAKKVEHKPLGYKCKGTPGNQFPLVKAYKEGRLDDFLASLTDADLAEFLYGHPMMNASNTNGIGLMPRNERIDVMNVPLVPTADGPAGLRVRLGRGVLPTYFPCGTTLSQTWNLSLIEKVGKTAAREVKENNVGIWLAPGMNIHRSPLCGRNFEYYSEDPFTTGMVAAACVKGVQSQKIAATIKHYCGNNRENSRRLVDSQVSQRALREIYLRGFEIAIKKANPWALMTSYNPVNGEQMSKNWEAINGILRKEWKYQGVVMTDWRTLSNLEEEVHAGSDVKMPIDVTTFYENAPEKCDLPKMMAQGELDRGAVLAAVRRILLMMEKMD